MKKLYLLRHAEAASDGVDDKDRRLSAAGTTHAGQIAAMMAAQSWRPTEIIYSTARRTDETHSALMRQWPDIKAIGHDSLYLAPAGTLLDHIHKTDEAVQSLLVLAHNPGIHQLAGLLAGSGEGDCLQRLQRGFSTGGLAVLECPVAHWAAIRPGDNHLHALIF